ncbi:MAG: aldo/keto reductase [Firmicutes bacterium]|nr:aldo/keto reductase [Bacillota bacterium]
MKYNMLGRSGLKVSEMCLGILPMGPLQANIPEPEGAAIIRKAIESGINFLDTAETYRTYSYIKRALKGYRGEVIIATKSPAALYLDMEKSVQLALDVLGRDYIDIFLLHAARTGPEVLDKRRGALECLLDQKQKGVIRAVGISTHSIATVRRAARCPEIDVIFPLINRTGTGIIDGTVGEMIAAIGEAADSGKGVYAMKALAGGHLVSDIEGAIDFVRKIRGVSSVAVGVVREPELMADLAVFNDMPIPDDLRQLCKRDTKRLVVIKNVCKGCGTCVEACPNGALAVMDGKAQVDHTKCILCGYCYPECPQFALRLV